MSHPHRIEIMVKKYFILSVPVHKSFKRKLYSFCLFKYANLPMDTFIPNTHSEKTQQCNNASLKKALCRLPINPLLSFSYKNESLCIS